MTAALAPAVLHRFGGHGTIAPARTDLVRIGVTGTRESLTREQGQALLVVMTGLGPRGSWLHHGVCQGADAGAHFMARRLGWQIHGHPGVDHRGQSPHRAQHLLGSLTECDAELPYGERNRVIVSWAHRLLACPLYPEHHPKSLRSGTWQTVRMARDLLVPVTVIMPDGSTTEGDS